MAFRRGVYHRDNTFAAVAFGEVYRDPTDEPDAPDAPYESGMVYFVRAPGHGIKIGFSLNVAERIKDIQGCCPIPLLLVGTLHGGLALERLMRERFVEHRLHGEWFHERILPDVLDLLAAESEFYSS